MKSSVSILYQDDDLVIINKPAGLVVVPERWEKGEKALNEVLSEELGPVFIVHRLDRDTSGVLVFARNPKAHAGLCASFESRAVEKTYHALSRAEPRDDEFVCAVPLHPDGDREHRTIVDGAHGKPSKTCFKVLERYRARGLAVILLEAHPETGRTHQVRVHATVSGCPIIADPLYHDGKPFFLSEIKPGRKGDPYDELPLMSRTALHAFRLAFPHPATGETLAIEAPYPRDFQACVNQLRKKRR